MPRRYEIEIAPTGYRSLKTVKDKKLRREIAKTIDALARAPEDQGKALLGPLEGMRSVHAARGCISRRTFLVSIVGAV